MGLVSMDYRVRVLDTVYKKKKKKLYFHEPLVSALITSLASILYWYYPCWPGQSDRAL
jgi:hypothetical protein